MRGAGLGTSISPKGTHDPKQIVPRPIVKKVVRWAELLKGHPHEWVTQLLRQGDSQVFKEYSQMKLEMKREAHKKLNRLANEMSVGRAQPVPRKGGSGTVLAQSYENAREWILESGEML